MSATDEIEVLKALLEDTRKDKEKYFNMIIELTRKNVENQVENQREIDDLKKDIKKKVSDFEREMELANDYFEYEKSEHASKMLEYARREDGLGQR